MPLAYAPSPTPTSRVTPLEGALAFASQEEQEQRSVELLGAGALLVRLPPPTSHVRGHLGSLLEELVERELARAGAPSPYLAAWSAMPDEANARLADQLLRAQAVGSSGLALALGTLAHIAEPSLCTDDSAILRWLAEATTALPLVVLIDDADMHVSGYAAPKPLMDLLVQHDAPVILTADEADRDRGRRDEHRRRRSARRRAGHRRRAARRSMFRIGAGCVGGRARNRCREPARARARPRRRDGRDGRSGCDRRGRS